MLGVTIDNNLSWECQISNVVKKCNSIIFGLYKIRHHLTSETRQLLIQAHIFPHILYCLSVWGGATASRLSRVQKVLNFAARVVTGARRGDHVTPILEALGWLAVADLVTRRDCLGVYRASKDPRAPAVIRALFTPRADISARTTRASSAGTLEMPGLRLNMSWRAFSYRAAAAWNRLPQSVTSAQTRASSISILEDHVLPC